jgi:hypothetical protein
VQGNTQAPITKPLGDSGEVGGAIGLQSVCIKTDLRIYAVLEEQGEMGFIKHGKGGIDLHMRFDLIFHGLPFVDNPPALVIIGPLEQIAIIRHRASAGHFFARYLL